MASTSVIDIETVCRLSVETSNLNTRAVYSQEIDLNNLKWKVKFSKKSTGGAKGDGYLAIHLESLFNGDAVKWSCEAQAAFKLLQKNGQAENCVVKYLPKTTFDHMHSSHGVENFIKWNSFLEQFVQDSRATFEIEITTTPLKRKRDVAQVMDRMSAKFAVIIENALKLEKCFSSKLVLQGVHWQVQVQRNGEFVAVFVLGDENDIDDNWFYNVTAKFTLLSFNRDVPSFCNEYKREFGKVRGFSWGYSKFIEWSHFVDESKKYISRNKAKLLVELKVEHPNSDWKIQPHKLVKTSPSIDCCVCLDSFASGKIFSIRCGHLFCKPCFDISITTRKVCPTCQATTTLAQLHPIFF